MEKTSRSEKRQNRQQKRNEQQQVKNNILLKNIGPKTKNQETVFRDFSNGKHLLVHGLPGTGKSFISLYLALAEIEQYKEYKNVTIIRSTVPSRDMGFLPGSIKEKSKIYEAPYQAICAELYGRGDAYELLKSKNIIDFQTSSFLRGLTLDHTIIIVDECQNMTYSELCTIITRAGNNAKIIFCGDYRQTDLKYDDEKVGIFHFMNILNKMTKYFSCIEFDEQDIVRSGLVKDFIIKRSQYENPKQRIMPVNAANFTQESKIFH
jgi:phosphate starvation-inducible protein PhoH